jgi:hypothetical protein
MATKSKLEPDENSALHKASELANLNEQLRQLHRIHNEVVSDIYQKMPADYVTNLGTSMTLEERAVQYVRDLETIRDTAIEVLDRLRSAETMSYPGGTMTDPGPELAARLSYADRERTVLMYLRDGTARRKRDGSRENPFRNLAAVMFQKSPEVVTDLEIASARSEWWASYRLLDPLGQQ